MTLKILMILVPKSQLYGEILIFFIYTHQLFNFKNQHF